MGFTQKKALSSTPNVTPSRLQTIFFLKKRETATKSPSKTNDRTQEKKKKARSQRGTGWRKLTMDDEEDKDNQTRKLGFDAALTMETRSASLEVSLSF
jgi:hypothetical protein